MKTQAWVAIMAAAAAGGIGTLVLAQTYSSRQVFQATLLPVNGAVMNASGSARIVFDGGRLGIYVSAVGLEPNITVLQEIDSGTACPTPANDLNKDGVIDASESAASIGAPVLALTLNLGGVGVSYPVTSASGSLEYIGSIEVNPLVLGQPGAVPGSQPSTAAPPLLPSTGPSTSIPFIPPTAVPSPAPSAVPPVAPSPSAAPPGGGLPIVGRVIVLHGVPSSRLPATVSSQDLLIACGVIQPVP